MNRTILGLGLAAALALPVAASAAESAPSLAIVAGTHLLLVDPATGKTVAELIAVDARERAFRIIGDVRPAVPAWTAPRPLTIQQESEAHDRALQELLHLPPPSP